MLEFTKLVIHRIAMFIFKYSLGLVPMLIRKLFAKNNQFHNYDTREGGSFTSLWGGVKRSTEHSHFIESIFGIIYQNIM